MPIQSKLPGWIILDIKKDPFVVGDLYVRAAQDYVFQNLKPSGYLSLDNFQIVSEISGPKFPGQTFFDRHGTYGYTVIRKDNNFKPPSKRIVVSKIAVEPLPLP